MDSANSSARTEIETLRSQVEEAHAALQRLDDDHAQLRAAVEQIAQRGCQDANGSEGWTCIEFDGTGLWCSSCIAAYALRGLQGQGEQKAR